MGANNPGIYDSDSFQRSVIPDYLKRDIRDVIETAVMFGWKMHISSANSVTLVSYDERKKFHFSNTGRVSKSMNQIRRDVVRFANPEKILIADSILGIKDRGLAEMATALLPHLGDDGTVVDHRPELEEEAKREREAKAAQSSSESELHPLAKGEIARSAESEPTVVRARHIVSEEPMMAKASEGKGYHSKAAIERHWSDGVVDYKCVECPFTSENRLSVRGHFQVHGKKTEKPKRTFVGDVPLAASYKPRKERVEALTQVIEAMLAEGTQDAAAIALQSLMWVHEQSRKGTRLAAEFEPLSPEETLARIRALLDDGQAYEEMRRKDEELAALKEQTETLRSESELLRERVDELESFIELANQLRRRDTA